MFQSTPPVRGATFSRFTESDLFMGFNPRPPCGERRDTWPMSNPDWRVSIHAPRAGSDYQSGVKLMLIILVSIHAPRAGSDKGGDHLLLNIICFNPRPPCGERLEHHGMPVFSGNVSIHAPRAGSDKDSTAMLLKMLVSIHAPRAGSDPG
ncbi:Uncharacterized protein dnm_098710 [Desulfonema magnum]|uniref:Uncharacterized protein n=1 Tax=Desulfonema magnum TaxID=45655 RepID=A0A975GW48_9BACT|nr:Uncharacterized protein dnm_098710 [Desulfonema magnum]